MSARLLCNINLRKNYGHNRAEKNAIIEAAVNVDPMQKFGFSVPGNLSLKRLLYSFENCYKIGL
jgi:hypothetical protein